MPRDLSGNFTLVAGNPVVTSTTIETTWANTTMSDLALQLNNVITRDGLLGGTSLITFAAGVASTTGAFSSNVTVGGTLGVTGATTLAALSATTGTFAGPVTGITNLTTTGNTILGNAQGDTLNVANGAIAVGSSGNVTIAAPSSGPALDVQAPLGVSIDLATLPQVSGAAVFGLHRYLTIGQVDSAASHGFIGWNAYPTAVSGAYTYRSAADAMALIEFTSAGGIKFRNAPAGSGAATVATPVEITAAGNVIIAAPSSGVGLTVAGGGIAVTGTSALAAVTGTTAAFSTSVTVAAGQSALSVLLLDQAWTVSARGGSTSGSATITQFYGRYSRIGGLVTAQASIQVELTGAVGSHQISLPVTPWADSAGGIIGTFRGSVEGVPQPTVGVLINAGSGYANLAVLDASNSNNANNTVQVTGAQGTYSVMLHYHV